MLKIKSVEISNIQAVAFLKFSFGSITKLRGRNETGKSSVIASLLSIFDGGLDPSWLRRGADKGYCRMELSSGHSITKTIRYKKNGDLTADLEVTGPDGVVVPAPKTFVESLAVSMAVNPAEILALDTKTADGRKKFIQLLLRILPISFSPEEIISGCRLSDGKVILAPSEFPQKAVSLDDLRRIRGIVEEGRRRIGIEAEQAEGAVASLKRSLPPEDEHTDWQVKVTECQEALRAADAELASAQTGVRESALQQERDATKEIDEQIFELQAKISALQEDKRQKVADINRRKLQSLDSNEQIAKPELDRIKNELATARERARAQSEATGVRGSIAKFQTQADDGKQRYGEYTESLKRLDALRKSKLDNLPVPDLEFDGDEVLYKGVIWRKVNTAGRVAVAVALSAELSRGELGFIAMDDTEHLDSEVLAMLESQLVEAGYQVLEAEVDRVVEVPPDQPFLIETK